MLLSVYKILKEPLELPWSYNEMRQLTSEGIKRQNQECSAGNELGTFWDMFEYMVSEGMIFPEGDFKIKYIEKIKTNMTERDFGELTPVLMMRPKHVILQYKKASRLTDEKTMSERSIRFYLMTSPGMLGKKSGTERFKVIIDGQVKQVLVGEDPNKRYKDLETFDNPLCFDYNILQQHYGINLEQKVEGESNEADEASKKKSKNPAVKQDDLPF